MDSMTSEQLNIIIGIVGILIGIISGSIFTWWQISQNRRLAAEAGALRKTRPSIGFLRNDLSKLSNDTPTWVILCPEDADKAIYSLSFQIINSGDAPINDAVLLVQGLADFVKDAPDGSLSMKVQPGVLKDSIKRCVVNLGALNQISYQMPTIYPNSAAEITDCFLLWPTHDHPISGKATSKDGVPIRYELRVTYGLLLTVTLLLKDNPSISHTLSLQCISANSIEKALKTYHESFLEKYHPHSSNLSHRKPFNKKRLAFIEFEKEQNIYFEKEKIYIMKDYHSEKFKLKVFEYIKGSLRNKK